jgi:hypothetical protein
MDGVRTGLLENLPIWEGLPDNRIRKIKGWRDAFADIQNGYPLIVTSYWHDLIDLERGRLASIPLEFDPKGRMPVQE